jgi:hypothetical protein
MEFLMMKLSDGRRLLVTKEQLGALNYATPEQAVDLRIGRHGVDIWWRSWTTASLCRSF